MNMEAIVSELRALKRSHDSAKRVLRKVRKALRTPEMANVVKHAADIMDTHDRSGFCLQCGCSFELHECPKKELG